MDYANGKVYVEHLREIYGKKPIKWVSPIVPPLTNLPPEQVSTITPTRKYNTTKPLPGATVGTTKLI